MKAFLALIFALSSLTAHAANWYVTPSGAGSHNGSSWNQAFNGTGGINWSAVQPGDTLWVAGGGYAPVTWGKSGTVGNPISFKRATVNNPECTGSAGWSAAFDSQVTFNVSPGPGYSGIRIVPPAGDNVVIDGQVPSGIVFNLGAQSAGPLVTYQSIFAVGDNLTFRYLETAGPQYQVSGAYGISVGSGTYNGRPYQVNNNILIERCYCHDCPTGIQCADLNGLTIRFCEIARTFGGFAFGEPVHDNGVYASEITSFTFANNYMHDFASSGFFPNTRFYPVDHYKIYGNLFYNPVSGGVFMGQGIALDLSTDTAPGFQSGSDIQIYNNTLVNVAIPIRNENRRSGFPGNSATSGGICENNLIWSGGNLSLGLLSHDYNFTDKGTLYGEPHGIVYGNQPFLNLVALDFHLVSTTGATWPRGKGVATIPEVSPDKDGVVRANPPSIGAYEYAGGGPTPPPAVPGTLAWSSANYAASETGGSITLTVSRTVGTDGIVGASYSFVNGTALAGHDFTGTPGMVSLGNGVSTATVVVPILNSGDTSTNARTFSVVLSSPTGAASLGPPTTATITIAMVPPPPPPLIGLASFPTFTMDQGTIVAPCFLTNVTQLANLANTDGAGSASYQVVITNAGVYWLTASVNAPNTAQNSIRVDINRDPGLDDTRCWDVTNLTAGFETRVVGWRGNGTFAYDQFQTNLWTLSPGTNTVYFRYRGEAIQIASVTFNQVAPPPPPPYAFLSWDTPGPINYQTSDQFTFHLLRTGDLTNATTVDYMSVDGTAKAGINYIPVSGTFTFPAGVGSVPLTLKLLDTGVYIPSQYFSIVLTNASANATIMQTNLTVTILQAAPAPVLRAVIFNNVKLYNVVKP